jgi:hypothetical protein
MKGRSLSEARDAQAKCHGDAKTDSMTTSVYSYTCISIYAKMTMGLNHEVKAERSDPATPHHPVVTACRPMVSAAPGAPGWPLLLPYG